MIPNLVRNSCRMLSWLTRGDLGVYVKKRIIQKSRLIVQAVFWTERQQYLRPKEVYIHSFTCFVILFSQCLRDRKFRLLQDNAH